MSKALYFTVDASAPTVTLNPFNGGSAQWIEKFLRSTCTVGLSAADKGEIEDQIEALVPAVVELRDAGHISLNAATLAAFGSLDGFMQLASDERWSDLARRRCDAIHARLIVQGVKALLGR